MKRRTFIGRTSKAAAATVALSSMARLLQAQDEPDTGTITLVHADQDTGERFEMDLDPTVLSEFETLRKKQRVITLTATYVEPGSEAATVEETSTYDLRLTAVEVIETSEYGVTYEVEFKTIGQSAGSSRFDNLFNGVDSGRVYVSETTFSNFAFLDAEGNEVLKLEDPASGDGNYVPGMYGCFLTTACTQARGLADDCHELETLRALRDGYMQESSTDRSLVDAYQHLGPAICTALARHPRADEAFDLLYRDLVEPSVALIEAGDERAAVDHYAAYVRGLSKLLNLHTA